MQGKISPAVWTRVREGYAAVKPAGLPADYNPVKKVSLHVFMVESVLHIEELVDDDPPDDEPPEQGLADTGGGDPPEQRRRVIRMSNQSQLKSLQVQVRQLHVLLQENHNQHQAAVSTLQEYCSRRFNILGNSINRHNMVPVRPVLQRQARLNNPRQGMQPVRTMLLQDQANLGVDRTARLSPCPRTLLALWHEYVHGLNGNKPAKDFTARERGLFKCKYSRRKTFWTVVAKFVRAGYTDLAAIDKIKQAYGVRLSVTAIINSLQRDRNNPHPNLVI